MNVNGPTSWKIRHYICFDIDCIREMLGSLGIQMLSLGLKSGVIVVRARSGLGPRIFSDNIFIRNKLIEARLQV